MKITIVGAGRAGSSFAMALLRAGYEVRVHHHDEIELVSASDLVLLCVPDDAIESISDDLAVGDYVVAHVAGSLGLAPLKRHQRRAFMHPLAALSSSELGAARLVGARYSVGGDDLILSVVASLNGRTIRVPDDQRVRYHATAAVTANHLVALMGHVEVLAEAAGLSLDDFLPLAQQALSDVATLGVSRALTGPASRSDMTTIDAHLAAIPESERSTYVTMANVAFGLAEQRRMASAQ